MKEKKTKKRFFYFPYALLNLKNIKTPNLENMKIFLKGRGKNFKKN